MSTASTGNTGLSTGMPTSTEHIDLRSSVRATSETKSALKTTELIAYVLSVAGVLIASAMIDNGDDGQGFGAERAWLFITMLTIGYMISRGLAKCGSYASDDDGGRRAR